MAFLRSIFLAGLAILVAVPGIEFSSSTRASEVVHIAPGSVISLATPGFIVAGRRYAFTWASGGPAQTHTVKSIRPDGWVLVDVADENTNPNLFPPGEFPTRWLNIGSAISIQEMRPHR